MRKRILFWLAMASIFVGAAVFAQPSPVEVSSHNGDKLQAIKGSNKKPLRDGCPIFLIRSSDSLPGTPKAGTGIADNEFIIQKNAINELHENPGELYLYFTTAPKNEFWKPTQAIIRERLFFRVFDTTDSTFASGTPYAESDVFTSPASPTSIPNVHVGAWKRIP